MIFILGWLTILVFAALCILSGLPDYIRHLDEDIKEKHRTPVKQPKPRKNAAVTLPNKGNLKRVK